MKQEIVFEPVNSARILVVGDIILDQYIYGETNRISPEAPVPIVRVSKMEERPGGAANVAVNIASLDVSVKLLGITGQDEAAKKLEGILVDRNVECHFINQSGFPTITKKRVLSQHQQLIRLDYENDGHAINTDDLVEKYIKLLDSADIVVLSDYAKGSLLQIQTLINHAREKNITVLVDPKSKDFSHYSSASVVTPNQKEFEAVVGECRTVEDIVKKGHELCNTLELDALLITRGENGMSLIRTDTSPVHLSAETHEVYDVTGAGDTVIAVLAAAMGCQYNIHDATVLANKAAGIVVEKLGAATVTVNELNGITSSINQSSPVVDETTAIDVVKVAKENGKKIVMTNGCFDILHVGHVNYLAKARSLGDMLIVAINDDASVKKLKGDSRPVNSLQHRMTVMGSLKCVDLVVPFSEDTPEQLITKIMPDVLVKGGDYTEDQIAGAEQINKSGGEVVVLPFEEGCSTSLILEKIKG